MNEEAIKILEEERMSLRRLAIDSNIPQLIPKYEAITMAIEALKAQEWIPCSERLPKEWEHVLVTTDTPYTFNKIRVDWNVDNYWVNYGHHVIAWMPSPEPYKE